MYFSCMTTFQVMVVVVGHKMKVETEQNLNEVILNEFFMNRKISECRNLKK